MRIHAIFFCLFFFPVTALLCQKNHLINVYFEESSVELIDESLEELEGEFSRLNSSFEISNVLIESFPNTGKPLREKRCRDLVEFLTEYNIGANKILHYSEISHLYFPTGIVENWNLVTLTFTSKEIEILVSGKQTGNEKYQEEYINGKYDFAVKLKQGGTKNGD